jgi:peptidoglycan hydrolase-like protein with peptidoglycan-binding domain
MKTWRYGIAVGLLAGLGACSNMMGGGSGATRPVATTQPTVAPEMVRQVQSKLRDDGYYKQGPVDGVWGSGTETAVRSFQHDHNLGSSGQLDVPTLQALNVAGVAQASNNTAPVQPMNASPDPRPANVNPNPPLTDTNANPPPADNPTNPPAH